jgi:NTP pyrophosphatase (non-canonical NTP hydrolase)
MTQQQFTYKELVLNLTKPGIDILTSLTPFKCNLIHMMIGVVGEVFELKKGILKGDARNILEELGDAHFYVANLCYELDMDVPDCQVAAFPTIENIVLGLETHAERLLDLVKRHVIYLNDLDEEKLADILASLIRIIYLIGKHYGYPLKDIRNYNQTKLLRRYTGGTYSDADGQARKDKDELDELKSEPAIISESNDPDEPGESVTAKLNDADNEENDDIMSEIEDENDDGPGEIIEVGV